MRRLGTMSEAPHGQTARNRAVPHSGALGRHQNLGPTRHRRTPRNPDQAIARVLARCRNAGWQIGGFAVWSVGGLERWRANAGTQTRWGEGAIGSRDWGGVRLGACWKLNAAVGSRVAVGRGVSAGGKKSQPAERNILWGSVNLVAVRKSWLAASVGGTGRDDTTTGPAGGGILAGRGNGGCRGRPWFGARNRKTLTKIDLRRGSNYNTGELPSRLAAAPWVAE